MKEPTFVTEPGRAYCEGWNPRNGNQCSRPPHHDGTCTYNREAAAIARKAVKA